MDNIENWIYLILGAIYFLSKLRKKNKSISPKSEDKENTASKKVKTFEELLGELTGLGTVEKRDETVERTEDETVERTEDETVEREEDEDIKVLIDEKSPNRETPNFVFDKRTNSSPLSKDEKTVQDPEVISRDITSIPNDENYKEYSTEDKKTKLSHITTSEIKNEIKSVRGIKKALIFSEILKRKY